MKRMMLFALAAAGWMLAGECLAQETLPPVDQSAKDPSFASFKAKLLEAVAKHDRTFIESILAKSVRASFGEDAGPAGFHRTYQLKDPKDVFWREMATILKLGVTWNAEEKLFVAPYVFSRWPEKVESFDYAALIAKDVPVRTAPKATAKEKTRLSYAILEVDSSGDGPSQWIKVKLPKGGTGYVPASVIRSPIDYRAGFQKIDGRWKLTFFLAGD